jgi:hypothetical protein
MELLSKPDISLAEISVVLALYNVKSGNSFLTSSSWVIMRANAGRAVSHRPAWQS